MKIAFINFEYLPDTGFGGIATYAWNAARMLVRAGHHVEVACASTTTSRTESQDGVLVHRIVAGGKWHASFGLLAAAALGERHRTIGGFDVIESPDGNAEGAEFARAHPNVALVIKLHTPLYILERYNKPKFGKLRFAIGAIRRGKLAILAPYRNVVPHRNFEKLVALAADRIAAPSSDIARRVGSDWLLPAGRVSVFPLPFESPGDLIEVPLPRAGTGKSIVFVGRLEPRKGAHHLGRAFSIVKRQFPDATLRCLGRISQSPLAGVKMDKYMRWHASSSASDIEFPGPVAREELACELARADVCIFPSLWENFPYVCLEAMTAARAIVGSSAGGMAEMLSPGAGILVKPGSPARWATAISKLMQDGERRRQLGKAARARVEREYCYDAILPQQVACYQKAYECRRARGPRGDAEIPNRPPIED